jgi:hypothetical protein
MEHYGQMQYTRNVRVRELWRGYTLSMINVPSTSSKTDPLTRHILECKQLVIQVIKYRYLNLYSLFGTAGSLIISFVVMLTNVIPDMVPEDGGVQVVGWQ